MKLSDPFETSLDELCDKVSVTLAGYSDDDAILEFQRVLFYNNCIWSTDGNLTVCLYYDHPFNDIAVDGKLLLSFLKSLSGDSVFMEVVDDELLVAQDHVDLTLPTISSKDFLNKVEEDKVVNSVPINGIMTDGLSYCIKNTDRNSFDFKADITFNVKDGTFYLYATDNETICEYQCGGNLVEGQDFSSSLSRKFGQILIEAGNVFNAEGVINFCKNSTYASFKEGFVHSISPKKNVEVDFGEVINDTVGTGYEDNSISVTDSMREAFERLGICGPEAETKISVKPGYFEITTGGDNTAMLEEQVYTKHNFKEKDYLIKSALLYRHSKKLKTMTVLDDVIVFQGENIRYVVASI